MSLSVGKDSSYTKLNMVTLDNEHNSVAKLQSKLFWNNVSYVYLQQTVSGVCWILMAISNNGRPRKSLHKRVLFAFSNVFAKSVDKKVEVKGYRQSRFSTVNPVNWVITSVMVLSLMSLIWRPFAVRRFSNVDVSNVILLRSRGTALPRNNVW